MARGQPSFITAGNANIRHSEKFIQLKKSDIEKLNSENFRRANLFGSCLLGTSPKIYGLTGLKQGRSSHFAFILLVMHYLQRKKL